MAVDGMRVIDFHSHIGAWPRYGMTGDPEQFIAIMDTAGVDRACLFHIFDADARRGNDVTRAVCDTHPDRLLPFAFVTPHYPDEMQPELDRAFDDLGMRGIKVYPVYTQKPIDDPVWEPVFRTSHQRRVPVICHSWGGSPLCAPKLFLHWAERYPDATIVLGHAGGPPEGQVEAIEAAKQSDNLYLEICSSYRDRGTIERMVEGVGAQRVLFGSDMALMEPAIQVGRVLLADIPDDAKRLILGENAARVLGV